MHCDAQTIVPDLQILQVIPTGGGSGSPWRGFDPGKRRFDPRQGVGSAIPIHGDRLLQNGCHAKCCATDFPLFERLAALARA